MKKLIIYGNSGLGSEVKRTAECLGYEQILFFDDNTSLSHFNSFNDLITTTDQGDHIFIAIASVVAREKVFRAIEKSHFEFVNIIHPSVQIHPSIKIGFGNYIAHGSILSNDISIEDCNLINSAIIGHHVTLGSLNTLGPLTFIGGNASIGNMNSMDLRSSVLQGKTIKNCNHILPLAIVSRNYDSNNKLIGFPSRKL
jgi:UDP-3-O-[3-hydroxymyristoyl] glucosamine N-acyltransferase